MKILKNIIDKEIGRLVLVVWPPYAEEGPIDIDMSIGIVFRHETNNMLVIACDTNRYNTPRVNYQAIPQEIMPWDEFDQRMTLWMSGPDEIVIDTEYYEMTSADFAGDLVGHKIRDVELVYCMDDTEIGVKIILKKDFILCSAGPLGSSIETRFFNQLGNVKKWSVRGEIEYFRISDLKLQKKSQF